MSAKTFTLQAVLELRARAKELAEEHLRAAHQALHVASELRAGADAELEQVASQIGGDRFTAVSRHQGWIAYCAQEQFCRTLLAHEREQEAVVARATTRLVHARCEHELVLKLREKWVRARVQEQARREERQLEEFFTFSRHVEKVPAC